jgi:hypothetical protein
VGDVSKDLGYAINKQQDATDAMPGAQAAIVISADSSGVRVKIPDFHPDWAFGPAKYSWPGTGYPPPGTPCLVEFVGTDLTQPWIVAWQDQPGTLFGATGTTGTTTPARFVGGTTGGAPTSGTYAAGDFCVDSSTGATWVCSVAGSPGTWEANYWGAGLTGATGATRYVGGTTSGAPTAGTFAVGDFVVDRTGATWVCTVGGSPGTWRANYMGAGLTGATAASRYVGATTAGPPTTGAFVVGDYVVDQSGVLWICTVAGSPGTWTPPNRKPTGDLEMTIRTTAKPNTLLLNGATVSRTTYAGLWAWVQSNSLVVTGLFTNGDGTTTFGLPDFRGRVPRGVAATGEAVGALVGADTRILTTANMPAHSHGVTIDGVGDHDHFIAFGGSHGGHNFSGTIPTGSGLPYGQDAAGDHNHNMNWNGGHNHGIHENSVGSGSGFDNRQASIGVNYLIWT